MNTATHQTAAEQEYRYTLTGPEIEVVEIIRLAHMQAFRITIEHRDGAFAARLVDTAAGKFIEGYGATFEDAWRALPGADLDGLGLWERIAARGKPTSNHLRIVERQR